MAAQQPPPPPPPPATRFVLEHARVLEGGKVRTGEVIGGVGATGNARSVGCHLHFEMRGPGGPSDPLPQLRLWDRWS